MIATKVYHLSRTEMARLTSEEYVRSYWFFVVPVPIIGLIAMMTTQGPMQAFGLMAMLWPFSIPARSVLITAKSSRLFINGCHIEANEESVTFLGEYHDGKRLRYALEMPRIRDVVRRREILLLRTRMPGLAPIKVEAFESEDQLQAFYSLIESHAGFQAPSEEPVEE